MLTPVSLDLVRRKSTLNSSTQTGRSRHRIENVRLAPYEAAAQLDDGSAQCRPMFRVLWKLVDLKWTNSEECNFYGFRHEQPIQPAQ